MRGYDIPNEWTKLLENDELARIFGDITGDGHLQLDNRRGLTSFYSKEKASITQINKRFRRLFKVGGCIYFDNRKNPRYKIFFPSKKLATFLALNGLPVGNKTNVRFSIPEWIKKGDSSIKSAYLKGIFTSEACISLTKKRWRIHFEQNKSVCAKESGIQFLAEIRQMLNEFGIITSPIRVCKGNTRKDGSKSLRMQFDIERRYFEKFYKNVGFDNKKKERKLMLALRGGRRGSDYLSTQSQVWSKAQERVLSADSR